ncbi:serine hydrolase domain-containing protein [Streptomyces sp. NPDC002187]|uniref:serine hydrolase domain-containing protein n=1 Tax=Streptomyces sp. NPDC002187 TaxID=3364637 RepID=UPI0036881007
MRSAVAGSRETPTAHSGSTAKPPRVMPQARLTRRPGPGTVTDPAGIDFDSPEVQAAELPSSNGIGTVHALARMYAALIGAVDGIRLLTWPTLSSATREQVRGKDRVMLIPTRFSAGFMLPTEDNPMTGPYAFGHTGRGGSLAFADPEHGISFGYAMNRVIAGSDDLRANSLVGALRGCCNNDLS